MFCPEGASTESYGRSLVLSKVTKVKVLGAFGVLGVWVSTTLARERVDSRN